MNFLDWLGVTAARKPLEVGESAPDIVAYDEQGSFVPLGELFHAGTTLVYFYPKADTPGCTAEACSLRDEFEELRKRDVRVIGVSEDNPESQRRFKEHYKLPFILLPDDEHTVAAAFGVRLLFGMARRQSFLIRDGRVIWRDLHASTGGQARDVLRALENL